MLLVVLVMLGVAGYLTDIMRTSKSHQESILGIFVMKNGQLVNGRMSLTKEQIDRENRVDVVRVNGQIISGRAKDRKDVASNHQEVLLERINGNHDENMRAIEDNADVEKDRIDRQIGNVVWNQGAMAAEVQRKSNANNLAILQMAVKDAIETESKMTEKYMQAQQELENLSAKMTNHTVHMTGEAKKKLEHLKLVEENARRAKEAAMVNRLKTEEEEKESRSLWRAIKDKIFSMLACSSQSPC